MGHRDLLVTQNLPQPTSNQRPVTSRVASAARAALFKRDSRYVARIAREVNHYPRTYCRSIVTFEDGTASRTMRWFASRYSRISRSVELMRKVSYCAFSTCCGPSDSTEIVPGTMS